MMLRNTAPHTFTFPAGPAKTMLDLGQKVVE